MDLKKQLAAVLCAALALAPAGMPVAATEPMQYYGDVNLDGVVDVADVVLLQKHILGLTPLQYYDSAFLADINTDGEVDIFDLGLLKALLLSGSDVPDDSDFIPAPLTDFYGSLPSQGSARMAVFYVDFPDCKYDYEPTVEEITASCFGDETSPDDPNYPFDSISAFYRRASKGAMELSGKVFRYTAKHPVAYYGGDDDKTLLMTELFHYYNRSVDFSSFDGNKDGIIDSILVNVPKTAPEEDWWACSGQNYSNLEADGVKIGHVTTGFDQIDSAEDHRNFVSTYLHESGHSMGLPDYYLYNSEDNEGFHGEAGIALMDTDAYSDPCCFSKLMLGWYREQQVQIYDTLKGGEQTFVLRNAQSASGNCLILPCGALDGSFNSEYMILEYNTDTQNNLGINRDKTELYGFTVASGVRAFHVQAAAEQRSTYKWLIYQNDFQKPDDGVRLIRLVNDREGGYVFRTGDILDGTLSGFHWYADDGSESADTGFVIQIGELTNDSYTVTVSRYF